VTKSRLDSLLERVNNVHLHTRSNEDEPNLAVLQHIKDFVKQNLFSLADVVVNVLEHEEQGNFGVFSEVLLNFRDHFNGIKLLCLFF
jgi:hypothetical protein